MHISTLFLTNFALSVVIGITLALAANRRSTALLIWACAMAMHAAGFGLIGLRGQINDVVSIVIGNTALAVYLSLLGTGVYRFQNRPVPWAALWLPVAITFVGFIILIDDLTARVLASAALLSVQFLLVLAPLLSQRRDIAGYGQYLIMAGVVVNLVCLAFRVAGVLWGHAPQTLFDPNLLYSLILFGNILALLLIMAGMIVMDHERTLTQLQQSEHSYRRLIESAQEGICILSKGRYRFINPRMAEMLGTPAEKLLDADFTDFVYPDDRRDALTKYANRVAGNADGMAHDIRLLTANGNWRWFRVSGLRIQWEGQPATLNFLSDIHDRKLSEEQTRQMAYHDELTQLPNRRMFIERLNHSLHSGDASHYVGVMFIDVNRLKALNDQHGHKAGDLLLIEVSRRLQERTDNTFTVARLGGDEFVILLPALSHDILNARRQAMQLAEQLRTDLARPYHLLPEGHLGEAVVFHSSASIGVHVFDPQKSRADDILNKADTAMYKAKKQGQGVLFFEEQDAA